MERVTVYPATDGAFAPASFPSLPEALAYGLQWRQVSGMMICSPVTGLQFALGYKFPREHAPTQLAMEFTL